MLTKLRNMIKFVSVTLSGDDNLDYPQSQVTSMAGKVFDQANLWHYGYGANPPVNSLGVTFTILGQEENRAGICIANPEIRVKNLQEGEVYIGNLLSKTFILFKENGNIVITLSDEQKITIKQDEIDITGSYTVNLDDKLTINSSEAEINVSGNVNLKASGTVNVDANKINLGTGGKPIARLGDQVQIGTATGTITSASTNNTSS